MKRYIPFKFEEVEETDGGFFKGVWKDKARYFQTKDEAEKYEKEGSAITQAKDKIDKDKADTQHKKNDEKDRKLGDYFKSSDGKSWVAVYDSLKGKEGKKDKNKLAYFKISDYKTEDDAKKAAIKKIKDNKKSLMKSIFGKK